MSNILVVDDKSDMCDVIEQYLTDQGYQVTISTSGAQALEIFKKNHIDLLLTDLKMPSFTGLDLLKASKEIDPELNVLIMTAYGTIDDAVQSMRLGASDFIIKPFSMDELHLKIQNSLQVRTLKIENRRLKDELSHYQGKMIGNSPIMLQIYENIRKLSSTKTTVLVTGESGTGKELVVQALHESSPWKTNPLIRVHCAALAPSLLESELFGHEKGAFTGANYSKIGRFELAQNGTLFLDEISEISPEIQVKLLRVLQEKEFERVGGSRLIKIDLRVVAATNKDLKLQVEKGLFREDLFYRLNVAQINLPPLRERREDLPLLIDHFLEKFFRETSKSRIPLNPQSLLAFQNYSWPGNIRELQNTLERAVVFSDGTSLLNISPEPTSTTPTTSTSTLWKGTLTQTLEEIEKSFILQALQKNNGNQSRAAKDLGFSRSALQYKILKYHLENYCHEL